MSKSKTDKKNGDALPVVPAVKHEQTSKVNVKEQTAPKGEAALNAAEEMQLKQFEDVIRHGLGGFMLVGKALKAISDGKLYRAKCKTFEDYCEEQWGLGKQYAYRLIDAYTVTETLKSELQKSPIGDNRLPTNESQVRPLGALESNQQIKAWRQVLKNCEGKPITADKVEAVVSKMGGKTPVAQTDKPKTELQKVNTKLEKIGKWVTETLEEDDSNMTVPKLKQILEKIRKLIGA